MNNAGIAIRKPLVDFTIDEARHLMDTNYFGCVAMCAAVVPGMMERRQGTIFNVGSGLGARANLQQLGSVRRLYVLCSLGAE